MYLYLVLFFILGLACSIFIEILGYRLPLSGDLFRKSYCDKCNHDLKLYENIPIISFFIVFLLSCYLPFKSKKIR